MKKLNQEVDDRMQLGYGSAWHMLRCLGFQREKFTKFVASAIGAVTIEWLDFPPYSGKTVYPSVRATNQVGCFLERAVALNTKPSFLAGDA